MTEIGPCLDWLKCKAMYKYGNKMCLGWNKYSLEVFDTVAIAF